MMDISDALFGPLYFLLLLGIGFARRGTDAPAAIRGYYIPALAAKLGGCVFFALIYQFYYGGGDTFYYFRGAKVVLSALLSNPFTGIEILFLEAKEITGSTFAYTSRILFFKAPEEWAMVKFGTFANLLGADTYLSASLVLAFFCFTGVWRIFRTLTTLYPDMKRWLALGILFIPSAIFWGSGYLKDTVTLGAIGFFFTAFMQIFRRKEIGNRQSLPGAIMTLAWSGYIILALKPYILITFVPCLALWLYGNFQASIRNPALKALVVPILLAIFLPAGGFATFQITQQNEKYASVDAVIQRVEGFQGDHSQRAGGSVYTLGEVDYTPLGLLSKLPASVNVTLFRPYPWEAGSVVVLISSAESMAYLFLTLMVLFRAGFFSAFRLSASHPDLLLCLGYTILLGFTVGFTAYNFGALTRFKIPLLPFFGAYLAILYDQTAGLRKRLIRQRRAAAMRATAG